MEDTVTISVSQETDNLVVNVTEGDVLDVKISVSQDNSPIIINVADPENEPVTVNVSEGRDGLSAYQLWLQQGNQGSLEDFLNANADKYFRYEQAMPAQTWQILHKLNKRPSVTVTDSAGTSVIGQVEYINENSLVITFTAAFSGYAELN
jgi:hypothetical protein